MAISGRLSVLALRSPRAGAPNAATELGRGADDTAALAAAAGLGIVVISPRPIRTVAEHNDQTRRRARRPLSLARISPSLMVQTYRWADSY
jgi:hypothetical protein